MSGESVREVIRKARKVGEGVRESLLKPSSESRENLLNRSSEGRDRYLGEPENDIDATPLDLTGRSGADDYGGYIRIVEAPYPLRCTSCGRFYRAGTRVYFFEGGFNCTICGKPMRREG